MEVIKTMIEKIEKLEMTMAYLQKQFNNMIRLGFIEDEEDIDYERQSVRVKLGPTLKTSWLKFTSEKAGSVQVWNPPEVGENVVIICPYGEIPQGVVIKSFFTDPFPVAEPSANPSIQVGDDIKVSYYKDSGKVSIDCKAFEVNCSTASIKNDKGEVISDATEAIEKIILSKTNTLQGPNPLIPAATEVPDIITKLKSFKEGESATSRNPEAVS